jgi:uncharacterized protein DUF2188
MASGMRQPGVPSDATGKLVPTTLKGVVMTLHVIHDEGQGWRVIDERKRSLGAYVRQRDAIAAAQEALREKGGGEIVVHRLSGRDEEHERVAAGSSG